jgi:formylglycine-generating enzyme required for sulfatase activity
MGATVLWRGFSYLAITALFILGVPPALSAEDAVSSDRPQTPNALGAAEKVRRAGELIGQGQSGKARDLLRQAVRECDSGDGDPKDCSQWLKSLQGFGAILDNRTERTEFTNSIGMKMVRLPAGEFMMGSPKREMDWLRLTFRKIWRDGHKQWFQDEMPMHPVRITRSFYMGATLVTVGQFREFVKATQYKTDAERGDGGMIFSAQENRWVPRKGMKWDSPPWRIADDQPVVFVSWNDAKDFCKWLSRKEKRTYRLPTEAEWEMACRGGSVWARYPWGNRLPGDHDCNFGDGNPKLPESLTTVDDGYKYVSPVTEFPPNAYGLYDMAGNVMQWVEDRYDRNYYENSPLEDPTGPKAGESRVNKGGNFYASPADGRCAFRGFSGPTMNFWNLGFRVVMEEAQDERPSVASKADRSPDRAQGLPATPDLPPSDSDGTTLFRQAMFAAQQQQWDQAVQSLEEALKIYETREDQLWVARIKATLAGIYAEQNRRYKSKELYTQALAGFRKMGDLNSARIILNRLQELETSPGVKVVEVKKGSIADKAGVVAGDVIIEYAGETGFKVEGFKKLVNDYARADKITLSTLNNEEISTVLVAGGPLGVAVEDIKRPPRLRPTPDRQREQQRPPRQQRGARGR